MRINFLIKKNNQWVLLAVQNVNIETAK